MAKPNWEWQDSAACHGQSSALFFGMDGERGEIKELREQKAKAICAGCPSRTPCLEYALTRREPDGTWGGLNPEERRREIRRRASLPPPPKPPLVVEKLCGCCGVIQPVSEFGKDANKKDGLHHWCKECTNEANRQRRRDAKQAVA